MENWLKQIIQLIEVTGDRVIVTEPDGKNMFVMLTLAEYQKMRGLSGAIQRQTGLNSLTEEQLLNRINREIADWKTNQGPGTSEPVQNEQTAQNAGSQSKSEPAGSDEKFYFEPIDDNR